VSKYGKDIGLLASRGDALAKKVMERYQYLHDHNTDNDARISFCDAFDEYLQRDLRPSERLWLAAQFGHMLDEEPIGVRVFVPGTDTPQ
jgi:hypothetical protein